MFAGKAPKQVTPGVKALEGIYMNDKGILQLWSAQYDNYGRVIGRTDYNAANKALNIPETHYHTYEYGPGYGHGKEILSHVPGEFQQ